MFFHVLYSDLIVLYLQLYLCSVYFEYAQFPNSPINVTPQVLDQDDPTFSREWQTAIRTAERNLIDCLRDHLRRVRDEANQSLRDTTKMTYEAIKDIDPTTAKQSIEDTLREADEEWQSRNTARKEKRKKLEEEAAANRQKKLKDK